MRKYSRIFQMDKYFISLDPEKRLKEKIEEQKRIIMNLAGNQTYLTHPAHTTLIVLSTNEIDSLVDLIKEFSQKNERINIKVDGFHLFLNDIQTNENTITYKFSEENESFLRKIQLEILEKINKYNKINLFKSNTQILEKMSELEKENINKYGYPFVGDNWIPHITLASIKRDKYNLIWNTLKNNPIVGDFLFDSISLYKIDENPRLIKKFFFR